MWYGANHHLANAYSSPSRWFKLYWISGQTLVEDGQVSGFTHRKLQSPLTQRLNFPAVNF
jgi:hypothetical protein